MLKKSLILLLGISLALIVSNCTKYTEEVPFFDDLLLEYDVGSGYKLIYNVYLLDHNKFKLIETDETGILGNDVEELLVDGYGRVYDSSKERYEDRFSPIWIPVHELQFGDKFDGRKLVDREDKWDKWEVLVIKDTPTGGESYYDLSTGYWVGSFAKTPVGNSKIILVDTNAEIPVAD